LFKFKKIEQKDILVYIVMKLAMFFYLVQFS